MNKLIKLSEQKEIKETDLIMVHINKARCKNYFWNWSSNHGDWVRTEKIPEELKKAYKNPLLKSNYK